MHFTYTRTPTIAEAVRSEARHTSDQVPGTADFIAGGTDLVQLLRERVRVPDTIVDINGIDGLRGISVAADRLRLGALTTMADAAADPRVREHAPAVAEALLASASPQVRNQATLGGNLLQRTRCGYFRDPAMPCNKRAPGSGCPALDGQNRMHVVLGGSEHCIATYAGDLAVALVALDAEAVVAGEDGARTVPVAWLHRQPGATPHIETRLRHGELVSHIHVPLSAAGRRSRYLKVRDRATFEWAVASAGVALEMDDDRVVQDARVAVGGVATTPWRLPSVEASLAGRRLDDRLCRTAAASAADGAVTHGRNEYKALLLPRVVARALAQAGGLR